MIHTARRTRLVASTAIFAVVYAILGLFPVSPYIGVRSFLTFREILSPLAGMIFGPMTGGLSMIVGNFVDFALGKPVVFDFLDFVPDFASAVMAGLVFTGRRKFALALPIILILWYSVDPLSVNLVSVAGVGVPFYWLHLVSVALLMAAFLLQNKGILGRLNPAYVAATFFASTMTGHIAGSILYENIIWRINGVTSPTVVTWSSIFFVYPPERILFTILGTVVAVPVLRGLRRRYKETNAEIGGRGEERV